MHVVGHQRAGVHRAAEQAGAFFEMVQSERVVPVCEEAGAADVPALDDAGSGACEGEAGAAGHAIACGPY